MKQEGLRTNDTDSVHPTCKVADEALTLFYLFVHQNQLLEQNFVVFVYKK